MPPRAEHAFIAPHVIEYPYRRSVGPVLGRFFTGLREGRIEGVRTAAGRVLVPPQEYDPETGEDVSEFVPVGTSGVVTAWSWVRTPRAKAPLDHPFAWALVRLDGADTALLHAVDAGQESRMRTGMRVRVRWREERVGEIRDIACFEPEAGEAVSEFVPVGTSGVVTAWSWVRTPRAKAPLDRPFAWALVRLDGADTALLHAVDAGQESRMRTGMRVRVRWREERVGEIRDIACFEPEAGAGR